MSKGFSISTIAALVAAFGSAIAAVSSVYGVAATNRTQREVVSLGGLLATERERLRLLIELTEETDNVFSNLLDAIAAEGSERDAMRRALISDVNRLQSKARYLFSEEAFRQLIEDTRRPFDPQDPFGSAAISTSAFTDGVSEAACMEIRNIVQSQGDPFVCIVGRELPAFP